MNTDALVFCLFFRILLFLDDGVMTNVNNFQIAKVQPQGVAWHLFDFLPKVPHTRC